MTTNTTNNTTRTPAITVAIDMPAESMVMTFDNGETICLTLGQLTADIATQAMWHGLKQKLVDAAAISRNTETGRSATTDDKYNAVREVYDRLLAGTWNKGRADGESSSNGGLLFRALCVVYADKTPEAIREFLGKKTKEQQAALRAVPKIAAAIDAIKAAKAKTGDIDTDSLLDELND